MRGDAVARVLLVEDEKRVATAVKRGLEAEGFTVDAVFDGQDGLWMAREQTYDVIVLDVMLPGVNGYQICATLREEGNWSPILMLTAKTGEYDEAEALDTGADDYLSKPFSYVVLVARLRSLLRRGARERPVELSVGGLRLDPSGRRVWRGSAEVRLTAREFSVLEFLVRRADEVVTKTEILGAVWDFEFEGDPNNVEVYIRRLRRKLDLPDVPSIIETIRGAGYRFDGRSR
jgi:two-component system OmpR family response regulator